MSDNEYPLLTPQLVEDVFARDFWAHQQAVRALSEQGFPGPECPEAVLFQRLQEHATAIVRARAATILGILPDQRAIDALSTAIYDPSSHVRMAAIRALAEQGERVTPEVWFPLLNDPKLRFWAMKGLGERLMTMPISSGDQEQQCSIAAYVTIHNGQVTSAHRATLLEGLRAMQASTRSRCVVALGYCTLQGKDLLPALMPLLDDPDGRVRREAIGAVVHLHGNVPDSTRQHLLHNAETGKAAALALARQGDPNAIAVISTALQADHEYDRENAVSWLRTGRHSKETGRDIIQHLPLSLILTLLADPYWPVSYPWAECVATLGPAVPFAHIELLLQQPVREVRMAALHVLARCGIRPPIAPPFALLRDPDVTVRRDAVEALLAFDVPLERLRSALESDHPAVAGMLAQRGSPEAIAILLSLLAHGDEREQWQAAHALATLSERLPDAPLLDALGEIDEDDQIIIQVLDVLVRQPEALREHLPAIITTLEGGQRWPILDDMFATILVSSLRELLAGAPVMHSYALRQLDAQRSSTHYQALRTLSPIPTGARQRVEWLRDHSPSVHVRELAHSELNHQS